MHGVLLFLFVILFIAMFSAALTVWQPIRAAKKSNINIQTQKTIVIQALTHFPCTYLFHSFFDPQLNCNFSQLVFQYC